MEVILAENIRGLGHTGDVVKVKNGYANNYLLPQGKALLANRANMKQFDHQKRLMEKRREQQIVEAKTLAEKLKDLRIELTRQASEENKLYGSVGARDILAALSEKGINIPKLAIHLDDNIKTIGDFDVEIKLAAEVSETIKVTVLRKEEAAEAEA